MSTSQIIFFDKNKADLDQPNCIATASQSNFLANFARNRSNETWWMTNGSVDSDNTTYTMDLVDMFAIDTIILIGHNLKNYTLKYWDGAAYQDFSSAIAPTNDTASSTYYSFTQINTTKVQLIIYGTQVANSDKILAQFIITNKVGQFNGWPIIKAPTHDKNVQVTRMLSGKSNVTQNLIGFSTTLQVLTLSNSADLSIIDTLFFSGNSFLVWLGGGNETQFITPARGFRKKDLYLMQCVNQWKPEPYQGFYGIGYSTQIQLQEVIK